MPILLAIGGIGAAVGGIAGFWVGGGTKAASDGLKYAVIGVVSVVAMKQIGWMK